MRKRGNISLFFGRAKDKFMHFIHWLKRLPIVKHILIFYLLITLLGSAILISPISINSAASEKVSYLDALFTSASAFSDTGLITNDTGVVWSMFGQAIIAILIFIGGIGWFALKVYIFNIIFNKPIKLSTRLALNMERGSSNVGVTRKLIAVAVTIVLSVMLVGAIILSFLFYYTNGNFVSNKAAGDALLNHHWTTEQFDPRGNWDISIRYGIFHAISAINNAGFDIMGYNSIGAYYYNYEVQMIFILLFVFGGIGYPVIYDMYRYVYCKKHKLLFKWSLFTKISMATYISLSLIGTGTSILIESRTNNLVIKNFSDPNNPFITHSFWKDKDNGTTGNKVFALFFSSMSTRNAGFATTDMYEFAPATKVLFSFMMFVGSAPSSTAGGIRTTTFGILVVAIFRFIRGKKAVYMFNRKISSDTVKNAFIVFAISFFLVMLVTNIGMSSMSYHSGGKIDPIFASGSKHTYRITTFADVFFETSSAFGTTGLSTGLTALFNVPTKICFILLMFIGQLGVTSTLLVWNSKIDTKRKIDYLEEDIIIG